MKRELAMEMAKRLVILRHKEEVQETWKAILEEDARVIKNRDAKCVEREQDEK